jgi:hypothetical protein
MVESPALMFPDHKRGLHRDSGVCTSAQGFAEKKG